MKCLSKKKTGLTDIIFDFKKVGLRESNKTCIYFSGRFRKKTWNSARVNDSLIISYWPILLAISKQFCYPRSQTQEQQYTSDNSNFFVILSLQCTLIKAFLIVIYFILSGALILIRFQSSTHCWLMFPVWPCSLIIDGEH